MQPLWNDVDAHLAATLLPADPVLEHILATSAEAGLPAIQVSPLQGRLLQLLVRLCGARSVLEVGTLGGYSTTWLARGLAPGGRVVTLENDPHHAEVARANLAAAGLIDVVEVRLGAALETLPQLEVDGQSPFDLVFVDADKQSGPDYLRWALRLTVPGSVVVVDNVVRGGAVVDSASTDPNVVGVRRLLDMVATEPRLDATALQSVGAKGYDGFLLALVIDPD